MVDGRYALKREIARGGMGAVFEALQLSTGRRVAVKMVHGHAVRRREAQERLLREAKAIKQARHRGIVRLLDAGICASQGPFVVLEMLTGRPLDGILAARRRLPVADVVHIGRQVCEVLAYVHKRGIIHRDIKPSNIFIAREPEGTETVKLFDFGIAALTEAGPNQRKLTGGADLLGTPEYMSPEQLFAEGPIDHLSDLYAVGVTLFECLTGEVPFAGSYPQVLMQIAKREKPPSPRELHPELSNSLAAVIIRALAKAPSDRFANATKFRYALVEATGCATGAPFLLGRSGSSVMPPASDFPMAMGVASEERPERGNPDTAPIPLVRRRFERAPYMTSVVLTKTDGTELHGRSEDISEGGLLVLVDAVPEEKVLLVRFMLPTTTTEVQLEAELRWVRDGRGELDAVGLQFIEIPDDPRRIIGAYVQQS